MGISLNPQLMLLVFVLFIVSIYVLNKWLYQPILSFMDARDERIKNDLANIDGNDSQIAHIDGEIHSILDEARKEASAIKESALNEAKADYANNIERLKSENDTNLSARLQALQKEKEELKSALLAQLPTFQASLDKKLKNI